MLILTFYIFTFYIFQRYVYTFILSKNSSGCNTQPSLQTTLTKANWPFKCKTVLSNIMGTIMKTASLSRLRQIITHAAVGASADACDKNIIQV